MTYKIADRVRETTNTAGTGPLHLLGAMFGCRSFSSGVNTLSEVTFAIVDPVTGDWEVNEGIFTSPSSLTRRTPITSSNGGNLVSLAGNSQTQVALVHASHREVHRGNFTGLGYAGVCNGRLTTTVGNPVESSDKTAQSVLYFTPYKGNEFGLHLPAIGHWVPEKFTSDIAMTLSGLTSGRPYDVFLRHRRETPSSTNTTTNVLTFTFSPIWNTGSRIIPDKTEGGLTAGVIYYVRQITATTMTLHTTLAGALANTGIVDITANITDSLRGLGLIVESWNSDTARVSDLSVHEGVYVSDSNGDERYLGTIYTTATTTIEDSASKRYLWNYYNQVRRKVKQVAASTMATYATATTGRAAGGDSNVRCYVVVGLTGYTIDLFANNHWFAAAAQQCRPFLAEDSTTTGKADFTVNISHNGGTVLNALMPLGIGGCTEVPLGHHYYQVLDYQDTTVTTTWLEAYLRGSWLC